MKAVVLSTVGDLRVESIPEPRPRSGEVLVRVAACGVCHTDLHVIKGEVGFPLPAVLGHEISGTVVETASAGRGVDVGARVVVPFILPCGRCRHCVRGRDDLCEPFFAMNRLRGTLYDGESRLRRNDGSPLAMYSMAGLAEYAVAPAEAVFPLPASLPLAEACIAGCALPTAWGAVRHQADLRPGERVAVVGTGGVGSNIIQIARLFGAGAVVAVDVREEKLAVARRLGASAAVNAATTDPVAAVLDLTDGQGVDVAFEALGRADTVVNAFRMTRDGGRVVVVGIAPGTTAAPVEITRLVRRSIRIIGSYGARMRQDVPEILALVAAGRLSVTEPVSRRFPLADAPAAYAALDRGEITGRAIVVME